MAANNVTANRFAGTRIWNTTTRVRRVRTSSQLTYDKLPYTSRILAENLVNRADKVDLPTLQSWLGQLMKEAGNRLSVSRAGGVPRY